ncbi:MAG TPA: hypothetical protein VHL57_11155 [Flavobacteriales bacterium]|jgi:hypothetical protein|nr:hypothetical protein [Flavobacteriales bacterium]
MRPTDKEQVGNLNNRDLTEKDEANLTEDERATQRQAPEPDEQPEPEEQEQHPDAKRDNEGMDPPHGGDGL